MCTCSHGHPALLPLDQRGLIRNEQLNKVLILKWSCVKCECEVLEEALRKSLSEHMQWKYFEAGNIDHN